MIVSSFASAESRKRGKHLAQKLDLSSEQMEKIQAHRKENKTKGKDIRSQMKKTKDEIDKAFVNGDSTASLNALHSKIKSLKTSQMDIQFNKLVFMKSVLNSEQRQKFIEMKKGRKKKKGRK